MAETDHAARLRYLFWVELTREERHQVLADLGFLEDTRDISLPIVRGAKRASEETPHALWDAIMARLPEDARETNPFEAPPPEIASLDTQSD